LLILVDAEGVAEVCHSKVVPDGVLLAVTLEILTVEAEQLLALVVALKLGAAVPALQTGTLQETVRNDKLGPCIKRLNVLQVKDSGVAVLQSVLVVQTFERDKTVPVPPLKGN
jgi:hypothetical protein